MRARCLLFLVVLLFPGVLSAQTKVGTVPSYLQLSPSVTINGMGEAGVALTGSGSPFYNPACVGFVVENRWARLGGLPKRADLVPGLTNGHQLGHFAVVARNPFFENSPMRIGIAFYRTNVLLADQMETSWRYPSGTGRIYDITFTTYNVSLGASYSGLIDVGLGLTGKIVDEDLYSIDISGTLFDIDVSGTLFDIGLLLRRRLESFRWTVAPSMGLSWSNIGPDIKYEGAGFAWERVPPRTRRFGLAVDFGYLDRPQKYRDWCLLTANIAFEIETLIGDEDSRHKLGLELGAAEAVYVRAGAARFGDHSDQGSWGITINTRGIARLIGRSLGRDDAIGVSVFESRLQIEFNYAKYDEDYALHGWLCGSEFYGISVSF